MPTSRFNGKTTANEVVDGRDISNLSVIVTGANTGIGFETARAFAQGGARVVFACRSAQRGQAAVEAVKNDTGNKRLEFASLDLANTESIKSFVAGLAMDKIDILVCNAGLVVTDYQTTQQGLEKTVGVCHYGHFLLTRLLLPGLLASGQPRIVMVSSEAHRSPKTLDFSRFPLAKADYKFMLAYGQAKLANALMANELQRRYSDQGLTACSLHPGTLITTEIGRNSRLMAFLMKLISPLTKTPEQGASTTMVCALEEAPKVAGQYYSDCQPFAMSTEAENPEVAAHLWKLSEQWCESVL